MTKKNKVVIILGMHRSGTSLLTQWLHTCGLQLGDQFLEASLSSPTGYYEDMDFLNYHAALLREQNLTYEVKTKITVPDAESHNFVTAQNLVGAKNDLYTQWGWKDPRTCLFIDLWKKIIPDAYYIILYRHHREVVESLVRRQKSPDLNGDNYFLWQWELLKMYRQRSVIFNQYLQITNHYNEQILEGTASVSSRNKLFLTIDMLAENSDVVWQYLTSQWGLVLRKRGMKFQIRKNLFRKASVAEQRYDPQELQKAIEIEERFQKLLLTSVWTN